MVQEQASYPGLYQRRAYRPTGSRLVASQVASGNSTPLHPVLSVDSFFGGMCYRLLRYLVYREVPEEFIRLQCRVLALVMARRLLQLRSPGD